ncbi:prephenate dehydrogenase [Planococcus massiliensis]|uniref:Prephenate dehydrogenase n=1 Tax=Planococcus massiliensis TaxID=1499687 RepID=A0A098EJV5_9BACL|nr:MULTISPECIES: prephenate dehydrogenase [Planococcus]MCJ1907369.1 prephenate dehydrogenase [Planococcus ruber]CEG22604.1 prephenate dehydrogenase [Planococcus massiliensis]
MNVHVLIIGLGLIGGSLAKALQRHPDAHISGYDADALTARKAYKMGIIHSSPPSVEIAAKEADVIIFATPVATTLKLMEQSKYWDLKNGVILTDTGSTKKTIMEAAKNLDCTFIGGHPMAGSHKSGVEAAKEVLFENAFYVLTPNDEAGAEQLAFLKELLSVTKAKIEVLAAADHDHMTAIVSHFPHLIAASLVHQLAKEEDYPFARQLAAGGFRDITRIASSNPEMWRDITTQNNAMIVQQMDNWMAEMAELRELLVQNEETAIQDYFQEAKSVRDELPIAGHGALYSAYDLYIDIPDIPGILSEMTGYLAEEQISIVNLRIIETREDVFGILVISFQTPEDREKARACFNRRTSYDSYIS